MVLTNIFAMVKTVSGVDVVLQNTDNHTYRLEILMASVCMYNCLQSPSSSGRLPDFLRYISNYNHKLLIKDAN